MENLASKTDDYVGRELSVIDYWKAKKIFERSVENRSPDRHFVFYDGPPFATGLPHYGHLLGSTLKDVFPRFWTMRGYRVERVWGWDCHGLPIENMIEKELSIKGGKRGIEELGMARFCEACRAAVLRLDGEWKKFIERIGRFVDMEHSYKTMDKTYIESVWWGFKKLFEKELVYEGRRVILYCSRCSTPLSDFEIAMDKSYREVEDESLYVKFEVKTSAVKEYLLAWTTTPWTLPGNVALAVDPKADYLRVRVGEEILILAESRAVVLAEPYAVVGKVKGSDLLDLSYQPLYDYLPVEGKKAYFVVPADFVDLSTGTGIVHTAAIYGEDDYQLALRMGLPTVPMLDEQGRFLPFVSFLAGSFFKAANPIIASELNARGLIYKEEKIRHSYPFCYRCETPLFYNAVPAWFVDIKKIKDELIRQNEKINWHPEHYKHGQFKDILESSPDWNISRSRYWGSPMPVWICRVCQIKKVIGSVAELVEKAVDNQKLIIKNPDFDLHRPYIDEIKLECECGGEMKRIPEVFDCWVESASMPFAAKHYPFENKEWFENNYPADFIGEYSGQVRAWFNVLHRISVALFDKPSFKNVSVTGVFLGTDGKKMSKSRGNYPDPLVVANRYGVDALRFYMMASPVMKGEDVIISEESIREIRNQFVNIYYNCLNFLRLYDERIFREDWVESPVLLDRWLISRTEGLTERITESFLSYDTVGACQVLRSYLNDLSTWYLRRSRDHLRGEDRASVNSRRILATALIKFSKMTAPITPFAAEVVYRDLTGEESVHLADWSLVGESLISPDLELMMHLTREVCEAGHAQRKEAGLRVRQPLSKMGVKIRQSLDPEYRELVLEELNVKLADWEVDEGHRKTEVSLELEISTELKAEGEARELIRAVQDLRKEKGCSVKDKIVIRAPSWPEGMEDYIKRETLASELLKSEELTIEIN